MCLAIIDINSVGINQLVCANHGVIYDPWWNFVLEDQAIGRLKRDGQTRPVFTYRLLMGDTVDTGVAEKADKKKVHDQQALPSTVIAATVTLDEEREDAEAIVLQQVGNMF